MIKHRFQKIVYVTFTLLFLVKLNAYIYAYNPIYYTIKSEIQIGKGDFAPFYFTSNQHGIASHRPNSGYLSAAVSKEISKDKRFDYGFTMDMIGSYNNRSSFWIQQLYFELKYRCIGLVAGSKEYSGEFRNTTLTSGSLVWSGNARPIPQVRAGIFDFVSVPGTNGWLQIKGDISYGIFTDNKWLKDNFNYYNSFITTDSWYHQKKIFFRSKEDKAFVATIGAEFAAQFGGKQRVYLNGELTETFKDHVKLKDFFTVLIPRSGGETANNGDQAYFYGNHLGSWHAIAEYKFRNKSNVRGYFEWLFDDGSGMGKLNGGDGLWGIEYNTNRKSILSSVVFEYLQTTNQSGPIHWAPGDFPGTDVTPEATGADNYYNNFFYNGWAHYGMSNGSPLLKSPAYNTDGYLCFTDNRVKAFHLGLEGQFSSEVSYLMKHSIRRGWGTPFAPFKKVSKSYSGLLEITYAPTKLCDWRFSAMIGIDTGNNDGLGNNQGLGLKIIKSGIINM